MKIAKYQTCPECGSHLDFGEICDCMKGDWGWLPYDQYLDKEKDPTDASR